MTTEWYDCDLVVGRQPRIDQEATADQIAGALRRGGVQGGLVSSLRAAFFDLSTGNDEALATAFERGWWPSATLDLRDPLGSEREMQRLIPRGVRAIRFAPETQGVDPTAPGFRALAREVARNQLVALVEGDVRRVWQPFAGLNATVLFLDTHFYHLGDFVVLARDEPGFHTSTRLLGGPDSLETVATTLGPERMLLGTRSPLFETLPPLVRLRNAKLDTAAKCLVGGDNLRRLLAGSAE